MSRFKYLLSFILGTGALFSEENSSCATLFDDLALVEKINQQIHDELPFFESFTMVGGYFNMPSARMPPSGTLGIGGARVSPYNVYAASLQPFSRLELSVNYRVYTGIPDTTFGHMGFGDMANRIGNIKIGILAPEDGWESLPLLSYGMDDFFGSALFNSQYGVLTKIWRRYNFELSVGWGKGRLKGFFGGFAWSPFRHGETPFFKDLSLVAEWDAFDYKKHRHEHPDGRKVNNRVNAGLIFVGLDDTLQISVSTLRGTTLAGSASLRYPIGSTTGLLPKTEDPPNYTSPVDQEPLGVMRPEKQFAQELAYAFSDQGLDIFRIYLYENHDGAAIWLRVANNRYREENVVRERIQDILAALTPPDIKTVTVVVEADALRCQEYVYRQVDLNRLRLGITGEQELSILSPRKEATGSPDFGKEIFHRRKQVWSLTFRPRALTFFGGASGKFKYNLGLLSMLDGYFFDQFYYRVQVAYSVYSTMWSLKAMDILNPSKLLNVRTDTMRYFQNNNLALEKAYVQKGCNLGRGWFYRIAAGYFEPAYGGLASEFLLFPAQSNFAVGIEAAGLLKRDYHGLAFTTKIRKLHGHIPEHVHFIGYQYFLDLYYLFHPLRLDFHVKAGSFLARDKGARFEVARTFSSGFRIGLWYTVTNGHDKVNGSTYYDKGFMFMFPLDFFLSQSSRNYINYGMSAWLRDVGAVAETGKELYMTLREEREKYHSNF